MKKKNCLQICLSLFLVASAGGQSASALEQMLPGANAQIAQTARQKTLKGSVAKKTVEQHTELTVEISNSHQYYVMFTSDDQISRDDYNCARVSIKGSRGTVFATNGSLLQLLSGHICIENAGSTQARIMTEFGALAIQPGSDVDVYHVNDRDEVIVRGGSVVVEQTAQPTLLHTGEFVTRDGQCNFLTREALASQGLKIDRASTEPLRAWASEGAEFGVTPMGVVELLKGECVFSCYQPLKIKTLCGSIESSDADIVAVRVLTTGFFVENCAVRRTLKVESHGHSLSLHGGESCILVSGAAEEAPEDGIGRRLCTSAFDGYITAFRSEFSMVSLIKKLDSVYAAYKAPVSLREKRFMHGWLKAIAALDTVHAGREEYSISPKIMQKGKLGNFVNPFLSDLPAQNSSTDVVASAQ